MATIIFSVPDDVKEAFNKNFQGENKSAVLTRMMRDAVTDDDIEKAREAGRS